MRPVLETIATRLSGLLTRLPFPIVEALFGAPPTHERGAPLDHQLHVLATLQQRLGLPRLHDRGVEEARAYFRRTTRIFEYTPPTEVETLSATLEGASGERPIRLYRAAPGERPGCLFFHGGGFVVGDLETCDGLCRTLAAHGGCHVVSVDYRLAPEHPFPAAVEDATSSFRALRRRARDWRIDPDRIAVAGDSAGGNLATVVCQRQIAREEAVPEAQLLIYPKTDHRRTYPSRELFGDMFYLTQTMLEWFSSQYLGGVNIDPERDPRVSPIRFEALDRMPPAVVVTAGFDPLRDEGEAYAERMREAGVRVQRRRFDRLVHGFATMGGAIDRAARATLETIEWFGEELSRL